MNKYIFLIGFILLCPFAYGITTPNCYDKDTGFIGHFNGGNNTTFIRESSNFNHLVMANGNAILRTDAYKYGTASLYLDGNASFASVPDSPEWSFEGGDFSISSWVYFTDLTTIGAGKNSRAIISQSDSGLTQVSWNFRYVISPANALSFDYSLAGAGGLAVQETWSANINTWYHLAVERIGDVLMFFVDGQQIGSGSNFTGIILFNSTSPFAMGSQNVRTTPVNNMYGYLDDVHIIKGLGIWDGNFSPFLSELYNCRRKSMVVSE